MNENNQILEILNKLENNYYGNIESNKFCTMIRCDSYLFYFKMIEFEKIFNSWVCTKY